MTCVENINKFIVPNDVIASIATIYKYIGKNEIYSEIAKSDADRIYLQTIEKDTYYLSKLVELDVTDARLRLIVMKNSEARNREERVLSNIKDVISTFQRNPKRQNLSSMDLNNIINFIYTNQNIKYDALKEEYKNIYKPVTVGSKRKVIDDLYKALSKLEKGSVEGLIILSNYIVDIYAIKPFTAKNDTLLYLLLYLMLLQADIEALKYQSFFELIYKNKDKFLDRLNEACYNYYEGFPQILPFIRLLTSLIIELYIQVDSNMLEYKKEQDSYKAENIEKTVLNLPNIFTKDDVRKYHPYVSESTINRALTKLREENIIKPLSKGRGAKWIKIGLK